MNNFWSGYAVGFAVGLSISLIGCADEQAERKHWQECGTISHEECAGDRACEYEYYKECINEEIP